MNIKGLRRGVMTVNPYVPGKTIEEVKREKGLKEVIKLGSNENAYAPFPGALEAMQQELTRLNCYPDITFVEIKELLSKRYGLTVQHFAISHGAEGMLQNIGKCFIEDGDEVIIPHPTYGLYSEISKLMGARVIETPLNDKYVIDLEAIKKALTPKTKLIWLCNPNNPTGTIFDKNDFNDLLGQLPDNTWIILDEAYAEFAERTKLPEIIEAVQKGKSVIAIRTFSKAFGLAGARIGYAISSPEMITVIDTVSEPFNANRVGLAGATATLKKDHEYYQQSLKTILNDRKRVISELSSLGFEVIPSETNFVFFSTPYDCQELANFLLEYGIIVRPCSSWGLPNSIRVTIGTTDECNKFISTLKHILTKYYESSVVSI
ncbi:MAG: histidinol-phosphate aminotransferase [Clostridia bacterium]|jgi:histidinol-phosphate aminotransferase|nr:histidinol-phosphate aminotransferase [Clostridia bacterium]MDN5322720.1 histidinol-phosphate aminotransferase [Clostridia bacterium]